MDERTARMCLAAVVEPGHPAIAEAVLTYGAEAVWASVSRAGAELPLSRRARALDLAQVVAAARAAGLRFVVPGDTEWPARVGDLRACEPVNQLTGEPLGLWLLGAGNLAELAVSSVAVVGSRASTPYGDTVAADLAAELSEAGRAVVSGGAYGVDASAHRGCLAGRTPTVAVLAGGLDQPYPAGHRQLFGRIAERGVLVSELAPGEHPTRVRFLARNRLIAAMTPGTVMVEAAARSGARNTVTWANELGRLVMAVPGPVTSATSVTPHRLIRDAEAVLVTRATDVLELVSPLGRANPRVPGAHRDTDDLSAEELRLFECVPGRGSLPAAELALHAELTLPRCLALLEELADRGFIAQNLTGEWQLPSRSRKAG
ncbi:MAG TPA: DNA-processing protein DprA [Propionicimonas sp.]|nr:DNA-processing protein DprA [Propionicimonas sp.]HRA05132.1 DNA-processing protein DprA [Propionicimonas sp.]